ncbi:MAG: hypothetical protein ACF8XB_25280 [Planctomycetota bacterium JB042]
MLATTTIPSDRPDRRAALRRATARKEWAVHRSLLVDYACAALVLVTVLPFDRPTGFALIGGFLAASMGVRIGGDEAMWGAREFVFTRPIARRDWFRLRFGLGLVPVFALLVLFGLADAVDLHRRFMTLFVEPLDGDVTASTLRAGFYAPVVAAALLVYAIGFGAAAREVRPEQVLNHRSGAWLLGGAAALLAWLFAAGVLRGVLGWLRMPDEPGVDTEAMAATVGALILPLVPLAYLWGRRGVERMELSSSGAASEGDGPRSGAGAVVLVLLFVVVLGTVLLWLTARGVDPAAPK